MLLQEENGRWSIKTSRVNTCTPRRGESQNATKFSNFNLEKKGNKKVETMLKKFHLKDNTIGFHPQTQKLELHTK